MFAGGIGEKSALLRRVLSEKCRSLGVAIDLVANDKGPDDNETVKDLSQDTGKGPRVLICQTNEQVSLVHLLFGYFAPSLLFFLLGQSMFGFHAGIVMCRLFAIAIVIALLMLIWICCSLRWRTTLFVHSGEATDKSGMGWKKTNNSKYRCDRLTRGR